MLVLTRQLGESLLIGDTVKIVVLEARGNQIRLGIDAPSEVRVLRQELSGTPAAAKPGKR